MGKLTNTAQPWRFGVVEFDTYSMELRRAGIPIKLRDQSSQILAYLLEMQVKWSRERSCASFFGLQTLLLTLTIA